MNRVKASKKYCCAEQHLYILLNSIFQNFKFFCVTCNMSTEYLAQQ